MLRKLRARRKGEKERKKERVRERERAREKETGREKDRDKEGKREREKEKEREGAHSNTLMSSIATRPDTHAVVVAMAGTIFPAINFVLSRSTGGMPYLSIQ